MLALSFCMLSPSQSLIKRAPFLKTFMHLMYTDWSSARESPSWEVNNPAGLLAAFCSPPKPVKRRKRPSKNLIMDHKIAVNEPL